MHAWLQKTKEGFVVRLQVVPNSSKNSIVGEYGDRLKVKITSPPVDGKANEALIDFIASLLKIKGSQIELLRGQSSKSKDLRIKSLAEEDFEVLKA